MDKFFMVIDVLGFKQIIKNLKENELNPRIEEWVTLVKDGCNKYEIDNYQLISDTLFVGAESEKCDLKKLILLGKFILEEGIKKLLPVRGAITYGTFTWGLLIYGKAVINAHELEMKQNWVGITLDSYMPHKKDLYDEKLIIRYAPPFKNSNFQLHEVVNWSIPDTRTLLYNMSLNGLVKDGSYFNWDLAEKLRNTIEFSIYKTQLIKNNGDISKFELDVPIQFIENYFLDKN